MAALWTEYYISTPDLDVGLSAEAENPEATIPESTTHTVPFEALLPHCGAPCGLAQVPAAYTTPPGVPI